ncbi:hypothetical protein EV361DRAFT_871098 [Lentinula raphanica]|nr:hypothetical protein F5880DRAFT_1261863 [Lentinula raphanica]KAJ3968119.1 hypothetical protein EV361DRAFT_871098 [Lentinula raphanica]
MKLFHKLTLVVCLLLFVTNAAPAPTAPTSPSVSLATPVPVYFGGASFAASSAQAIANRVHPLGPGKEAPPPYVDASVGFLRTKSLVDSKSFNDALLLAVKTLLKPAIPGIIEDLRNHGGFVGLKYTDSDDLRIPIVNYMDINKDAQQDKFYELELAFSGKDDNGRRWQMESLKSAYVMRINKECVVRQWKITEPKFRFKENLLTGVLGGGSMPGNVYSVFKEGKQLDPKTADTTGMMLSTTAQQKSSWFSKMKDKVFSPIAKKPQGVGSP